MGLCAVYGGKEDVDVWGREESPAVTGSNRRNFQREEGGSEVDVEEQLFPGQNISDEESSHY